MSAVVQGLQKKAQFCRLFLVNGGHCPNGDDCPFIHDISMINSVNPAAAAMAASAGMQMKMRPPFVGQVGRSTPPFDVMSSRQADHHHHGHVPNPSTDANNGDQYFNATFQPLFPSVKPSRPSPAMGPPPYADNGVQPQILAPPSSRFLPPNGPPPSSMTVSIAGGPSMGVPSMSGPSMGGPSMSGPSMGGPSMSGPSMGGPSMSGPSMAGPQNKLEVQQQSLRDPNMINSFSSMSLSSRDMEQYKAALQRLNQGVNPGANEFIPKNGVGGGAVPVLSNVSSSGSSISTLSHSSSTPSFTTLPGMVNGQAGSAQPPTALHLNHHHPLLPLSAGTSPVHSPGLSPTHSPRLQRRAGQSGDSISPKPAGVGLSMDSPSQSVASTGPTANDSTIQENVGGTTYFYTSAELAQQLQGVVPPSISLYPGIPPHIAHMKQKSSVVSFGAAEDVKLGLLNKQAVSLLQLDPVQNPDIPVSVDDYEHLFPLEPPQASAHHKSPTIGYPTTCYRATGTKDGLLYCLRRVHGFRLTSTKCMQIIDLWKKVQHSNLCHLREVFTTKGFGDHSIVFVYDYHPTVSTMMTEHFTQQGRMNGMNATAPFMQAPNSRSFSGGKVSRQLPKHSQLLPECLIWHYIIQLTSALWTVHKAGLAFRVMDPTKIILTNQYRLWLNCCGILDVLGFDATQTNHMALMPHYQQEDLLSLGKLILALACNSIHAVQRDMMQNSVDVVARNYSTDLRNLIVYLLSNHNRPRNVSEIMPMIGARFYAQLDAMQQMNDVFENELAKELENSRLYRLVCKLGLVNDRAEFNMDPSWSETGDRYMLKLFRDYLFHQVDEHGAPWIDMAHMVQTLNKLDSGSPEKICLVSRDQSTVLIVSYAELKNCFESAVSQLQQASASAATQMALS